MQAADGRQPTAEGKELRDYPHIAWASFETRQRLILLAADNIRAFLDGTPKNVVG